MADYSGYFMQGFASMMPGMASQIQAAKLKKEQKKEAEKVKQDIANALSTFLGNNQEELDLLAPGPSGNDFPMGSFSDYPTPQTPSVGGDLQYQGKDYSFQGMMGNLPKIGSEGVLANPKLITFLATVGAIKDSLMTVMKDVFVQIDKGNVKKYEEDMEYIKNMIDAIKEVNLAGGDINSHYGFENLVEEESKSWFRAEKVFGKTPASKITPGMVGDISARTGAFSQETIEGIRKQPTEAPAKLTGIQAEIAEMDKLTFLTEERRNKMKVDALSKSDSAWAEKVKDARAAGAEDVDIVKMAGGGVIGPEPTTTTQPSFKTLQDIKDAFKNVKTKAEYDSALQSYNASKEAKASDWTPSPWEAHLTDLIKKVEQAIWADFVNKNGKLKDKNEAELYNTNLQHYLKLIEEARKAGIDVSQFQVFIPYKKLYMGLGDPLVIKESW